MRESATTLASGKKTALTPFMARCCAEVSPAPLSQNPVLTIAVPIALCGSVDHCLVSGTVTFDNFGSFLFDYDEDDDPHYKVELFRPEHPELGFKYQVVLMEWWSERWHDIADANK